MTALTILAFAIPGLLLALQGQLVVTDPAKAVTSVVTDPWTTVTLAGIATYLMEKLKSASWFPWLSEESGALVQRVVGILIAAASALGVTYSFDSATGQLVINNLLPASMGTAFWEFVKQFVAQQGWYHAVVKAEKQRAAIVGQ